MNAPSRILIVGPSWVGDMVMAQALFMELKDRHPDVVIDVLAPAWTRPLLARMPEINLAIDSPFGHGELGILRRRALGMQLKKTAYDQAIVLPNSFKSALIPWFAGIERRTGWRGEKRSWVLNDCRVLDKNQLPLMVQRFIALALPADSILPEQLPDPVPVPRLRSDKDEIARTREMFGLDSRRRILMLCPGAEFGDAKRWPADYFAEVANARIEQGWQVVLLGSENDRQVTDAILDQTDPDYCLNLAGETSLSQAIDLLAMADAVVSNDSGLMHIAAALHRPLVAIYGSTSADFTPPLTDRVELLSVAIECRPCFARQCPLRHKRCLTELLPARVLAALQRLDSPVLAGETQSCES